ncbi:putative virion structural protein [uncultured virus]|uniref:Putative virion structural protein n=1 Tax=uncultured virus TaxID=340016 RepID=A0A218MLJ1_9VIRU|nr:putative virion structural protein [uncultured virus]
MAVLYTYPIKSTPANRNDLVIISDSRDGNKTKQIAVANLPGSASFSGIGGSGEANYIPKFSTSTDLVNSIVYDGGSKIGIGTTSPAKILDVNGDVTFGTGNKFQTITNALEGVGTNGVYLRSAISSAANPSFSNSDDTNTGMFLPGEDVLGLSTAGSERFRITNAGNVGLGTASPAKKLTVRDGADTKITALGSSSNDPVFFASDSSGNLDRVLMRQVSSNAVYIGDIDDNDGDLVGRAGGVSEFIVKQGGNIGMGVNVGSVNAKLDIINTATQPSIRVTDNTYNNYLIQKRRTDDSQKLGIQEFGSNGGLSLVTAGSQRLNINNLGNVGIGTTSPGAKLHVRDSSASTSTVKMSAASANSNYAYLKMTDSTANTAKLTLGTTYGYSTDKDTITLFNGSVGIGTTTPDSILTVKAATANVGIPVIKSGVNGFANGFTLIGDHYVAGESQFNLGISYSGANGVLSRGVKVSNTADDVFLSSQDAYSTNPSAFILDRDGSLRFLNTSTNASTPVGTAVSLSERMRIKADGKVGVGTVNPTADGLEIANMVGVSGGNTQLFITGNTSGRSVLGLGDGSNRFVQHILTDHTQNMMSFHTGASAVTNNERMRITSDGNVGIGTTSPSNKLTVGTISGETNIACASTGFDSLRLGLLTFPTAAGWYRVAQYATANARGGARIDLCITGGDFAPVTYSIDYFKSYTQTGTEHTLKLEQYGGQTYVTKARIAVDGSNTFVEVYKNATTNSSGDPVTMPAQVHFNRLIGESGGSFPLFGTPASGSGSTSLKEVEFIAKGTSVESLRVQGGKLNLKNLPTSTSGLVAGDIYNDGGTLKIVS